jgi:tripartite-type tricarboxylate transporter receptor subunit TctC
MLLACHPSIGATSVAELVARASETELAYATSASGGAPHLAAVLFQRIAGVGMRHVQYRETTQLYRDLETGRVALSFNNIISMLPRCRSGALNALAVTSHERSPVAPEIPTLAESGVAGYAMTNWTGIAGPRGMTQSTVSRLTAAITAAVRSERVSTELAAQGIVAGGGTPEAFASFVRAETEKWRPVVAELNDAAAVRIVN